jgi:hypothetical protein
MEKINQENKLAKVDSDADAAVDHRLCGRDAGALRV